jgi:hypothetical protein
LKKRSAAAGHPGARQKKLDSLMIKIAKAPKKLAGFVSLPKAFAWPKLARPANDEPGRLIDEHPRKAAAVQISPVLYSRQGTVEKVVKKISELGKQGVQFATFSETVVPYYPYFSWVQPPFLMGKEHLRLLEESVTVPSAETHAIGASLRRGRLGQSGWQSRGHRHQSGGAAIRLLRANARDELNFSHAEAA